MHRGSRGEFEISNVEDRLIGGSRGEFSFPQWSKTSWSDIALADLRQAELMLAAQACGIACLREDRALSTASLHTMHAVSIDFTILFSTDVGSRHP